MVRGFDIALLKPTHMKARDEILDDLLDRAGANDRDTVLSG
jgi:hypothetical protein